MRISRQGEAEMADIVRAVFGLRLAPQHHLVDQRRFRRVGDAAQHAIEVARMHLIAGWQRNAEPVQEVAQRREFFIGRRRVHAIHHRLVQALQFLRGRDVGQDHELLDQPVAVEARPRCDAAHDAVVVQHDPALRQVEIERAARSAGGEQGTKRRIQMRMPGVAVRRAPAAPPRRSGAPRCASGRGRSDGRLLRRCASIRISTNRQPRSSLRAQAAPAVGQRLGQHRHDAVGEIDAVAAGARRLVERRSGRT